MAAASEYPRLGHEAQGGRAAVGGPRGGSLHAGVSFGAPDRKGRERLARHCTRPPLAMDRPGELARQRTSCGG